MAIRLDEIKIRYSDFLLHNRVTTEMEALSMVN